MASRLAARIQKFLDIERVIENQMQIRGAIHELKEQAIESSADAEARAQVLRAKVTALSADIALITSVYNLPANDEPPTRADTKRGDPHVGQ